MPCPGIKLYYIIIIILYYIVNCSIVQWALFTLIVKQYSLVNKQYIDKI